MSESHAAMQHSRNIGVLAVAVKDFVQRNMAPGCAVRSSGIPLEFRFLQVHRERSVSD
jgi:hypothetical protein